MNQKAILDGMKKGGRIVNKMYINPDNTPGEKISDLQIQALAKKGVIETIGYDKTRTYRMPS